MKFRKIETKVTTGTDGQDNDVVLVTVFHDARQSFSKAVDPAAKRAMRAYMAQHRIQHATLTGGNYGLAIVDEPDPMRCNSQVCFTITAKGSK